MSRLAHGRQQVGCSRRECICHEPTMVCDEFKAWVDGDEFCAECGWNEAAHPQTTPGGQP